MELGQIIILSMVTIIIIVATIAVAKKYLSKSIINNIH